MTKDEIIDKLYIKHEVWQAGYTREQLEGCTIKQLKSWLEELEE